MPWLLWITGTPMWIRHGRLIDSRLPTTRPTPDPHLRNTSVTHKPHSFYDCGGLPIALPNIIIEFMQKERLFPMVMPEASFFYSYSMGAEWLCFCPRLLLVYGIMLHGYGMVT